MSKLSFSGHESFHCRAHWLKKGYDFIKKGHNFNDLSSVVELGVGKNMVNSIYFWMQSFGLYSNEQKELTEFANFIFGEDGVDPYLEDIATLWLLHYYLIKTNKASIYSLVFNDFKKERIEFTKDILVRFIERKCNEFSNSYFNLNTVERDINVLLRNYIKPKNVKTNLEENYNYLFVELDLINELKGVDDKSIIFKIENKERKQIPFQVILFSILDSFDFINTSISLDKLLFDKVGIGNIFSITTKGLLEKINEITNNIKTITFKDNAGTRELQIKNKFIDKWEILKIYYEA
jgi:hypothetical protein